MLGKALRLIEVLKSPAAWKAMTSWKPFSIASFILLSTIRRLPLEFGTIIDCGANVGQFARAASQLYPEADVISFEALPEVAKTFRANLADRSKVRLIETAIGNQEGTITFYPHAYSQSSSALQVRPEHETKHVNHQPLPPIERPITKLDTVLADQDLRRPILLKLDLQGFELEALKGAPVLLGRCEGVLVETVFEEAYDGEPLFEEISLFLQSQGFRFVRPLAFMKDAKQQIYQMDALFLRTPKA